MGRLPTLMQVLDAAYEQDQQDPSSHLTDDLERLARGLARAKPRNEALQNLAAAWQAATKAAS